MAYDFFINRNSTLPSLRMEVIDNGRDNFHKLYNALQSADVYFTMTDIGSGIKKIANAQADVVQLDGDGCEEKYVIEYKWKERDTKTPGLFRGQFKIVFDNAGDSSLPDGELVVPISEELFVHVNEGSIRK